MSYDFSSFKNRIKEVEDWLSRELATVRTGRATPAILDGVKVLCSLIWHKTAD